MEYFIIVSCSEFGCIRLTDSNVVGYYIGERIPHNFHSLSPET